MFMPSSNPTKMGSENMDDWKSRAATLFFMDKLTVSQVADVVNVSRKSVGEHLKSLPDYESEKEARKLQNALKRKEYKREWDRHHRNTISTKIDGDTLRRDHEQAVIELSREKYH